MNLIKFFSNFFNKNKSESDKVVKPDIHCINIDDIKSAIKITKTPEEYFGNGYNENRKNLLIIDDNFGIVSLLKDSLKNDNNIKKLNFLTIKGQNAPVDFICLSSNNESFKIDYLIVDLIFGCVVKTDNKIVKLSGIDILCEGLKKNKNLKFLIFTGNRLDETITENREMIKKFKKITGNKNIFDYVIFKGKNTFDERNKIILEKFFGEKQNEEKTN